MSGRRSSSSRRRSSAASSGSSLASLQRQQQQQQQQRNRSPSTSSEEFVEDDAVIPLQVPQQSPIQTTPRKVDGPAQTSSASAQSGVVNGTNGAAPTATSNTSSSPAAEEKNEVPVMLNQTRTPAARQEYLRQIQRFPKAVDIGPRLRYIKFEEKLGAGSYKNVYLGLDSATGQEVAWNSVNLKRLSHDEVLKIKQECEILSKLRHPHIVKFFSMWTDEFGDELVFVSEKASGTLKSYVGRMHPVRPRIIRKWCRQILLGLEYLHAQKPPIIHRDLKCENIFIDTKGDVKIGDFGLSVRTAVANTLLGTPGFLAPELFEENYDERVDIYAFGMCVLEMVTNEYPYAEESGGLVADMLKKGAVGAKPAALQRVQSKTLVDFINLCLAPKDQRPSAAQLLAHPVMVERNDGHSSHHHRHSRPSNTSLPSANAEKGRGSDSSSASDEEGGGDPYDLHGHEDPNVILGCTCVGTDSPDTVNISIKTDIPNNKTIEIPDYNLKSDSPETIVDELLEALALDQYLRPILIRNIERAIHEFLGRPTSSAHLEVYRSASPTLQPAKPAPPKDVRSILEFLDIPVSYADGFEEQCIEVSDLPLLMEGDLVPLLPKLGHRRRFQHYVANMGKP